jgi:hypothetical protein
MDILGSTLKLNLNSYFSKDVQLHIFFFDHPLYICTFAGQKHYKVTHTKLL